MRDKNTTLTYRWMQEVWNEGREEAIDEMMDENAVVNGLEGINEKGAAGFKAFFRGFRTQFPKVNVDVEAVIADGDFETARCLVKATTAGGQDVSFGGMTIIRVVDGKIAEAWNNFDFLSMYQQLGFKMAVADEQ